MKTEVPLETLTAGTDLGRRLARLERKVGVRGPRLHLEVSDRTGVIRIVAGPAPCPQCPTDGGMAVNARSMTWWRWPGTRPEPSPIPHPQED
jgi:hypothetical protein